MSLQAYLRIIAQFHERGSISPWCTKLDYHTIPSSDLNGHHGIEEAYVFPVLAQRMPNFANDERHKNAHKVIHKGKQRK
jgi:hypothetical protein